MGNHNRQWVAGRHAVLETLRAGRWKPLEVACVAEARTSELHEVRALVAANHIPLLELTADRLTQLCRSPEHQGLAMRLPEYPYFTLSQLIELATTPAAWLVLDRIHDSHNFGAILRSAEVFGFDGVVVGTEQQSPVNGQVVRASAGAVNHVALARGDNLLAVAETLKRTGCRLIGAAPAGAMLASAVDLAGPAAMIIGNEGEGIAPALLELCDECVQIPQYGQTESLNAAVSAGILCYELRRQRLR